MKLKKQIPKLCLVISFIFLLVNCNQDSTDQKKESYNSQNSFDGTYTYENNSAEISITVNDNNWQGKVMVKTGVSSDYNERKAKYPSGKIKGNYLYDDSGMAKVGHISGNSLTYSVFGQTITLEKN